MLLMNSRAATYMLQSAKPLLLVNNCTYARSSTLVFRAIFTYHQWHAPCCSATAQVVEGYDVVAKVEGQKVGAMDKPAQQCQIADCGEL
jgi:hypothetical protein